MTLLSGIHSQVVDSADSQNQAITLKDREGVSGQAVLVRTTYMSWFLGKSIEVQGYRSMPTCKKKESEISLLEFR